MKNQIEKSEDIEVIETVKLSVLKDENGNPIYVDKHIYDSIPESFRESAREAGRKAKEALEPVIDVEAEVLPSTGNGKVRVDSLEGTRQYFLERFNKFK